MGTGLFDFIAQACQSLAATVAPRLLQWGFTSSSHWQPSFWFWFAYRRRSHRRTERPASAWEVPQLFMLLTFAYAMVNYYDSAIPGLGFSIKSFIDGAPSIL